MTTTRGITPTKRRSISAKIPWPVFSDGRTWTLRHGEDYHSPTHLAISAARSWAWKNSYFLRVVGGADGVSFTVTFIPRPDHPSQQPGHEPQLHAYQWTERTDRDGRTWDHYACVCGATKSEPLRAGGLL